MDHDPEKETYKPCSDMPDGGRVGRCCNRREGCRHNLEAGSSKACGRCGNSVGQQGRRLGMHLGGHGAAGGGGSPAYTLEPRVTASTPLPLQSDSQPLRISCKSTWSGPFQDSAGTPGSLQGCLGQVIQVRPSSAPSPRPAPSPTEALSAGSPTSPVGPHLTFSLTVVYLQCSS